MLKTWTLISLQSPRLSCAAAHLVQVSAMHRHMLAERGLPTGLSCAETSKVALHRHTFPEHELVGTIARRRILVMWTFVERMQEKFSCQTIKKNIVATSHCTCGAHFDCYDRLRKNEHIAGLDRAEFISICEAAGLVTTNHGAASPAPAVV